MIFGLPHEKFIMRKYLLLASATLIMLSCGDNKEKVSSEDHIIHSNKDSIHSSSKNEMVSAMKEMMEEMHQQKPTGNIDSDYANMMSDHHEGAVEMSEILLQKSSNSDLKSFAQKVINAQNKEIDLLDRYDDLTTKSPESGKFQKEMMATMAPMMNSEIPVHHNIDKDYVQQMIPHHQSAVDMAKVYLKYGKVKELIALSKTIIEEQQKEIDFLKDWLTKN